MTELALVTSHAVEGVDADKEEASKAIQWAQAFEVKDAGSYVVAREFINRAASAVSMAVEKFKKPKQLAFQAHRAICELENEITKSWERARAIVEPKAIAWHEEQERKKREAEAALEAERKKREEDDRLALAEAMEEAGDSEAAEAVLGEEITTAPANLPKADFIPPVAGSVRKTFKHRVVNLKQLVEAVAAGKAPLNAIKADDVFLGQQARSYKKAGMLYPGVTVYEERGISAGR